MSEFEKRYKRLNDAQKKAVDTIDGPVMVVAGPGTGKTELLSMRVANILIKTDVDPQNILCLTYTESGATAMRERLISLMGQAAYRVNIYTFHGFGSMIISRFSEYFYNASDMKPADELTIHEVLYDIFRKLPHDNPLASRYEDSFSFLTNAKNTISDLKRAGLSPEELRSIISQNETLLDEVEPTFKEFFKEKITPKMIPKVGELLKVIEKGSNNQSPVETILPLKNILIDSLEELIKKLDQTNKTTALTKWKNSWLKKNAKGNFTFKSRDAHKKLRALSYIYFDYTIAMEKNRVYDYDDMILQLGQKLESEKELLYTLQEQYQYLLVDEFQDTNGAQMRILHKLTENPVFEGRPNIMTVGDDDQAIYRFQGADISNILDFDKNYRDVVTVSLTDNYRSSKNILEHARNVITQGEERLENSLKINKNLTPHHVPKESEVTLVKAETPSHEFSIVAEHISTKIKKGDAKPSDFAVIARGHADIRDFLPHLSNKKIPFSYEQNDNILHEPSVKLTLKIAELLQAITRDNPKNSDTLLPEILSHECFKISRLKLFELSVESYKTKTSWLEIMLNDEYLHSLGEAFISIAFNSQEQSLQATLDQLLGSEAVQLSNGSFVMPLKNFFFSADKLEKDPEAYLIHLQSLETLVKHYERYSGKQMTSLKDFVNYVKNVEKAGLNLRRNQSADELEGGIQIITAHGSKGLEFKNVYILNAVDEIWGEKSRGRSMRLSYPENMPIGLSGDRLDEKIRLFYVAMTRVKNDLHISYPEVSHSSKSVFKLSFLETDKWQEETSTKRTIPQVINNVEVSWRDNIIPVKTELKKAIRPLLKNYKLSPTHLNNFIDITEGGPRFFLLQNLLHFPSALHPSAAMGSSIHTALRKAHQHMVLNHASKPIEDIIYDFRKDLESRQIPKDDFEFQLKKGSDALQAFLDSPQPNFTESDISERDFRPIAINVGEANITGIIDCLRIDRVNKTIDIVDYKTGKSMSSWKGKSDYEKIKLHKYRQQLLFYKLMIESTPEFRGYKVKNAELSFVEPDSSGNINSLKIDWDKDELARFSKLINLVWQKIMAGEFVDTSKYESSYKGVISFEKDLLDE